MHSSKHDREHTPRTRVVLSWTVTGNGQEPVEHTRVIACEPRDREQPWSGIRPRAIERNRKAGLALIRSLIDAGQRGQQVRVDMDGTDVTTCGRAFDFGLGKEGDAVLLEPLLGGCSRAGGAH